MNNVLRTLIFGGQVSLTVIDGTEIVQEGAKLHKLTPAATYVFGKALAVMTYMSACLKEESGEISLSLKGNGAGGEIAVSGNRALRIRGYIENTQALDDLLHLNESPFPLCTDDAHAITGCFRGWTQIKAESLEYGAVMNALEKGDFYSSTGPEIHELYIEDHMLHVKTSAAREIFLRSERRFCRVKRGTVEAPATEAVFDLSKFFEESRNTKVLRNRPCFRLEIFDHAGLTAYTRAYFVDEILA